MNIRRFITLALCIFLCDSVIAATEEIDKELAALAERLATTVTARGNKKVAVIDFADLQGSAMGELGRYIAEELTVNLVMTNRDFSVLDRANLKRILAEHKLTASGLVDPDNAKKLGQFAGVDAFIMGTIVPKKQNISLTIKIITTETAAVVGAARAEFKNDETVQQLVSRPAVNPSSPGSGGSAQDGPATVKTLGDLRIEAQPLSITEGVYYVLRMELANKNPKKSLWVALNTDMGSNVKSTVTDANGNEFHCESQSVSGIEQTALQYDGITHATEIKPNESTSAMVKFNSRIGATATPGTCFLNLQILVGNNFNGNFGAAKLQNVSMKIGAN